MPRRIIVAALPHLAAEAAQCSALHQDRDFFRGQAGFNWWPQHVVPT